MDYRVEQKYYISDAQIALLKAYLSEYMHPDANMSGDSYLIRSIYFDDMVDSCLRENEDGVDNREKFRIRAYDNDNSKISLELKSKLHGYTSKKSTVISLDEYNNLLNRETIYNTSEYLKTKISAEMQYRRLQPVCIVEYERTAYVESIGNVRITFDRNIGATTNCDSFWDKTLQVVPILPTGIHILEVKYDELLPDYIKAIIDTADLTRSAFSKYYYSRFALGIIG